MSMPSIRFPIDIVCAEPKQINGVLAVLYSVNFVSWNRILMNLLTLKDRCLPFPRGQLVEFNILSTFVYGILQSRVFSTQVNSECFRCCKCNNRGCNLVQITDWFTSWWILFTSVVWVSLFIFMGWFWICSPDENCFISFSYLCCAVDFFG